MRVVFCGTAAFAVPSLRALAAAHEVLAVVTQPDRLGSRGRPAPRPVGETARDLGLPVLQPERIRAAQSVSELAALAPEVLVVAAYGQIIPGELLDLPAHGGVNVHGSLLPRWRGAAPVAAAILAGDEVTGVSIMRMDTGLDTGPVYATTTLPIGATDTAPQLTERLARAGADLLTRVLDSLAAGSARAVPQDGAQATLAPRRRREDGELDWAAATATEVDRHVRALQPWPGVTVALGGQRVRVIDGTVAGTAVVPVAPGTVLAPHGDAVDVAAAAGVYRVGTVQPPGGGR